MYTKSGLRNDFNCLIDRKEIPKEWWRNPFLSKTLHNSEYLTENCSLNKVRFAKLPLYGIEDDMEGKQMSELFGAGIISDEIERNAAPLGIDLAQCQRADLPKLLDQKIDEGNEEALRIARKFGNRLGMFLLLLKTGLPENRAIREDWQDEHWEYWANIETIYLVGGIANGRMCEYMLMVVKELFEKANVPMYNIVRNTDSPDIGAKGCLTQIENPDEVQILFDFGQTMMKRMIAVRRSEGEEYQLIKLPSKKSIDMQFHIDDEDEKRRQAQELHRYIVESIIETYEEAKQYGSIGWEIVISIASYVMDGKIYDARSGYAKLCTLSDNYAGFLAATLEIMLDRSIMVKLVHDGTAAALYYKGVENAVCITAGTAFGVGFPEIKL